MGRTERIIVGVILVATIVLAVPGVLRYGLTWDEPTYFRYARLQRDWLGDLFNPGSWDETFSPETVQRVWLQDAAENGHPPLSETWMGVVGSPLGALGMHDTRAFRIAMTVLLGISAALLFIFLRRSFGIPASVAGVLVYLGVPAVWAHGHIGATETPQLTFWILFALLTPLALKKGGRWLLFWLIVSCLSFATKFTNILIPVWVLGTAGLLGAYRSRRFWMLAVFGFAVGPISLLLIDPYFWPWQGGWERYADYFRQVTTRGQWVPLPVFYMGRNWGFSAPWHYRIVETTVVLPLTTLLLLIPGIVLSVRAFLPQIRERILGNWVQALGITGLAGALIVGVLPNSPNHDNTRQFVYIFVAVSFLAAVTVENVARRLQRPILSWLLVLPAAVSFVISVSAEPWGLTYYNELVGGLRGAWHRGFQGSYWGEAIQPEMIETLREMRPRGEERLVFSQPKIGYFSDAEDFWDPFLEGGGQGRLAGDLVPARYLAKWPSDVLQSPAGNILRFTFTEAPDAVMIFHNRGMVDDEVWTLLETLQARGDLRLAAETRVDDIPLASLYQVMRVDTLTIPGDPQERIWYRPASLVDPPVSP